MISFESTFLDYPSPDDIAVIAFLSGCTHDCKGCQNIPLQQLHEKWTLIEEQDIILHLKELCDRNETNKIVLSGGDPLNSCNIDLTKYICEVLGKDYDICIYTGSRIDKVKQLNLTGFKYIKCGKFDIENMQKAEKTDEYIQFVNKTQNLFDANFNQLSVEGRYYFSNKNGVKND